MAQVLVLVFNNSGPTNLAKDLKISVDSAKSRIESFYYKVPKLKNFQTNVISQTRKNGYITTISKRRRYFPDINHKDGKKRSQAERKAINSVIQGTGADILKLAMLHITKEIIEVSELVRELC